MTGVRIGLAQLSLAPLDVASNIERTVAAVEKAAADGADVVVLPELASSGYVLHEPTLRSVAERTDRPGAALRAWADVAAATRTTVVAGLPESDGDALYNTAVVLGPDGRVVTRYRKLHLFAGEVGVFTPGDLGLPVAEVGGLRLGVLVCYDLRFPEALRIHAARGVDLVAVPTAWVGGFDAEDGATEIGQVRTVRVLANLNATPVACASQVGSAGPFAFLGSSVLVDPFGNDVAAPASRTEESVTVLELDTDLVRRARDRGEGISPLKQRRTDVYDELLGYAPTQEEGSR